MKETAKLNNMHNLRNTITERIFAKINNLCILRAEILFSKIFSL